MAPSTKGYPKWEGASSRPNYLRICGSIAIILSSLCYYYIATNNAATPAFFARPGGEHEQTPRCSNLRIWPVGDSVTMGTGSDHGNAYRGYLLRKLEASNYNVQYVGGVESGNLSQPYSSGYRTFPIPRIMKNIAPIFAYQPNVVLVYGGLNDVHMGQAAAVQDNMNKLLDLIFGSLPKATVIVSNIQYTYNNHFEKASVLVNKGLEALVTERAAKGQHIALIDLHGAFYKQKGLHWDELHPNDRGYEVMAQQWYEGLTKILNEMDWVHEPEPLTLDGIRFNVMERKKFCMNGTPDFKSRGQVFDGNGFGKSTLAGTICHENAQNNSLCDCDYAGGFSEQVALTLSSCSAMSIPETAVVHFADINGDGLTDIIHVGPQTVNFYLQDSSGGFGPSIRTHLPASVQRHQVQFADVNFDGLADMITIHTNASMQPWLNRYDNHGDHITFRPSDMIDAPSTGLTASRVRILDVNGDGWPDYVHLDTKGAGMRAFLNSQEPRDITFSKEVQLDFPGATKASDEVQFGDVAGKGGQDYIQVDKDTGAVHFRLVNLNTNKLGAKLAINTGLDDGIGLRFVDMNGDGRVDLVRVDPQTSAVEVWINTCKPLPERYRQGDDLGYKADRIEDKDHDDDEEADGADYGQAYDEDEMAAEDDEADGS